MQQNPAQGTGFIERLIAVIGKDGGAASVPIADTVRHGIVRIEHDITNDSTDGVAASPDGVYAYAPSREEMDDFITHAKRNIDALAKAAGLVNEW